MQLRAGQGKRVAPARIRGRTSSLREQLKETLSEKILTGEFTPRRALGEKELAEQFGVNMTPAREALGVLAHEGLVQVLPRKRYLVTQITVQDVHEYFGLRIILECAAAELAATNLSDVKLGRLEELVRSGVSEERTQRMRDRNFLFHQIVARASGNMRLAWLIEQLIKEMRRLISAGFVPGEHEKLLTLA